MAHKFNNNVYKKYTVDELNKKLEKIKMDLDAANFPYTVRRISSFNEKTADGWHWFEHQKDLQYVQAEQSYYDTLVARVKYIERLIRIKSSKVEWGKCRFKQERKNIN